MEEIAVPWELLYPPSSTEGKRAVHGILHEPYKDSKILWQDIHTAEGIIEEDVLPGGHQEYLRG